MDAKNMKPRDKFIAALERKPIEGRVPTFELVFFFCSFQLVNYIKTPDFLIRAVFRIKPPLYIIYKIRQLTFDGIDFARMKKYNGIVQIYKRLSSVGLGEFCLTLHNHKAKC